MNDLMLTSLIDRALSEDAPGGDVTTLSTVPEGTVVTGRFLAKEDGVLCGMDAAAAVFARLSDAVSFDRKKNDGDAFVKGDVLAVVEGDARAILTGERVALNLMQHLSGVASQTAAAVRRIAGTGAKIVDTRKTTPGLRFLEKYAVRCGGGTNHRFGLSDGVLIKDNHIAAAGGIRPAVERARAAVPHTLKIEVEVERFDQLAEALDAGADIIMLDNMTVPDMKKAVEIVAGRALTEASGNMGEKDLREVALTGVDLISIGALTHSVRAADISLKFQ